MPCLASPWRSLAIPRAHLSLPLMLRAGQSFRWHLSPPPSSAHATAGVYSLALRDRVVQLVQPSDAEILWRHLTPGAEGAAAASPAVSTSSSPTAAALADEKGTLAWFEDYFQLGVNAGALWDDWIAADEVLRKREDRLLRGIRVLKMDPWECLFSFICSSNNHITRISMMVNAACTHFGPHVLTTTPSTPSPATVAPGGAQPKADISFHAFPPPAAFTAPDTESKLRALGFGYRARFIHLTAVALCTPPPPPSPSATEPSAPELPSLKKPYDPERWLTAVIRTWPEDEAREALMQFTGVGRKVADCVLLMSGGHERRHIVPVDVHVLRIAQKLYAHPGLGKAGQKVSMTPVLYSAVERGLRERWGEWAGWVQAVLFASDLPALLKAEASTTSRVLAESGVEADPEKIVAELSSADGVAAKRDARTTVKKEEEGSIVVDVGRLSKRINKRKRMDDASKGA